MGRNEMRRDMSLKLAGNQTGRRQVTSPQSDWSRGAGVYEKSPVPASNIIKAAKCSATIEGLICGSISFIIHLQGKKHIDSFDARDWREISRDTLVGVCRGAYRGGAIYVISSYTALSVPVTGMLVSAAVSIAEAAAEYSEGMIPGSVCVGRIAVGCLASIVYSVFAKAGGLIIPLSFAGPIVGGSIGIAVCLLLKESVKKIIVQQQENSQ